jgi:hypothetical protein
MVVRVDCSADVTISFAYVAAAESEIDHLRGPWLSCMFFSPVNETVQKLSSDFRKIGSTMPPADFLLFWLRSSNPKKSVRLTLQFRNSVFNFFVRNWSIQDLRYDSLILGRISKEIKTEETLDEAVNTYLNLKAEIIKHVLSRLTQR